MNTHPKISPVEYDSSDLYPLTKDPSWISITTFATSRTNSEFVYVLKNTPKNAFTVANIHTFPTLSVLSRTREVVYSNKWAPERMGPHLFQCIFCEIAGHHEQFSSVRQMYLNHCIGYLLEDLRAGKYMRQPGTVTSENSL